MLFPIMSQRFVIISAAVCSGSIYAVCASIVALSADAGCSLIFSSSPMLAMMLFGLATIPACALALVASATANPLAGFFTLALSLALPAVLGGRIDEWMYRNELPGAYWWLAAEILLWVVPIVAMSLTIQLWRTQIRMVLPTRLRMSHRGTNSRRPKKPGVESNRSVRIHAPDQTAWLGGLTAALAGGILSYVFVQVSDSSQVFWGLLLGFCIGTLFAHQMFPSKHALPFMLSPILVGFVAYVLVAGWYDSAHDVIYARNTANLIRLALPLPMFYASAGVAGVAMGIGWSQSWIERKQNES